MSYVTETAKQARDALIELLTIFAARPDIQPLLGFHEHAVIANAAAVVDLLAPIASASSSDSPSPSDAPSSDTTSEGVTP